MNAVIFSIYFFFPFNPKAKRDPIVDVIVTLIRVEIIGYVHAIRT